MELITITPEEDLRYFSSVGDEAGIRELIRLNVDVNSRNSLNGWTALHWAAARGHSKIVEVLLQNGAIPAIKNDKGETPANLTQNQLIHHMLGEKSFVETKIPQLPIIPSYLKYPTVLVFNSSKKSDEKIGVNRESSTDNSNNKLSTNELVLKARIADTEDTDFIEIELDRKELTIEKLTDVCCDEFEISKKEIAKLRKLPDTVIRKDRDVQRLTDYQEIEIVLHKSQ